MSGRYRNELDNWPVALKIALGLTTFYVFVSLFYLSNNWSNIIKQEPHDLGDTIAGFFSPLAFLWFATAVFLQKDELRAQRIELVNNREVLELQGRQLAASVDQFKIQNDMLMKELDHSFLRDKENRVLKTIETFLLYFIESKVGHLSFSFQVAKNGFGGVGLGFGTSDQLRDLLNQNGVIPFIGSLCARLRGYKGNFGEFEPENYRIDPNYAKEISEVYKALAEKMNDLNENDILRNMRELPFDEAMALFGELASLDKKFV